MLSGSLYQDYTTLVNMYNRQKPILTGNKDVDYKILENLEIKDLIKICQSNKYSLNLCNNNTFWFEKFHLNNLPIYAQGTDFTTWAQRYYATEKSYEKATNTLIVHEINAIDESIDITIVTDELILNAFMGYLKTDIDIEINKINAILSNNKYELSINDGEHNMIFNKKYMIIFLTGCYMYTFPYGHLCDINCLDLPLIINEDNIDYYLQDDVHSQKSILYTRKGILDCIHHFKK
jgi:hypothetical protein